MGIGCERRACRLSWWLAEVRHHSREHGERKAVQYIDDSGRVRLGLLPVRVVVECDVEVRLNVGAVDGDCGVLRVVGMTVLRDVSVV